MVATMNVGGEFLNVRCPRPEADREDSISRYEDRRPRFRMFWSRTTFRRVLAAGDPARHVDV
jgi:hypothetical protein